MIQRNIFFISDGTGITAETIGHSLMTQFPEVEFIQSRIPFVDTEDKALEAITTIDATSQYSERRSIVINTVIEPKVRSLFDSCDALVLDVFEAFMQPLELELGYQATHKVGGTHSMDKPDVYDARIEATNYAMSHDDGVGARYTDADLILVGVSRCGKTPTCLYMALQYGVKAANYPITQEDLDHGGLPHSLKKYRQKLFGLSIDPGRLHQIREGRRPGSKYSALRTCRREVEEVEFLFETFSVPFISTTNSSIEEISSKILQALNLQKELF